MEFDELSNKIINASMKVHSVIGPGLFESVYKSCLKHELVKMDLKVLSEVGIPLYYDGIKIDVGYRADLIIEDEVILELKSVEHIQSLHKAQLLTYLKLANKKIGLLINFNVSLLKHGIVRVVNDY